MKLRQTLEGMAKYKASDLHFQVGSVPMLRVHTQIQPVKMQPLTSEDIAAVIKEIMPAHLQTNLDSEGCAEFSHELPGVSRFRVTCFKRLNEISIAFRRIPIEIPNLDELHLPDAAHQLERSNRGIILVTGVTGSGKSTTLAALINSYNKSRRWHILTLEDPVEYLFQNEASIINQVEIGVDCPSFQTAMHHVLRYDPDVIMIGEMRTRETVEASLQAADTGHLVMSTLHTSDAKQTINRVLYFFDKREEELVLEQLALNLKAIISQRLLPRADTKGLVPAVELLLNTPIVTKLVGEGRIPEIDEVLKNRENGMQSFDISLALLTRDGKITEETAMRHCADESATRRMIRSGIQEHDRGGLIG